MPDYKLNIIGTFNNKQLVKALRQAGIDVDKLGGKTKKTNQDLGRFRQATSGMRRTLGAVRNNLLLVSFAMGSLGVAIGRAIKEFADFQQVEIGFKALGESANLSSSALDQLKDATDNTVNSMELMRQANNAMLLGIVESEEQMAEMFDMAQRLAAAVGKDATYGIESLTTGIGRQSRLMLDNLGIIVRTEDAYKAYAEKIGKSVSALTEQERKTAFINAAMDSARDKVQKLGEEQQTVAMTMSQFTAATSELAVKLGELLAPSVIKIAEALTAFMEGTEAFLDWADGVDTSAEALERLSFEEARSVSLMDGFARSMKYADMQEVSLIENMQNLRDEMEDLIEQNGADNILGKLIDRMGPTRHDLMLLNEQIERLMEDLLVATENAEPMALAMGRLTFVSDTYLDTIEKIPEAQFDAAEAQRQAVLDSIKLENQRKKEANNFVTNMQTMGKVHKSFEQVGKRATQTQALIDTYASANAAYKAMVGIPIVGPGLAVAAAAAAIGAGLANVKQIEAAQFGMDQVVSKPTLIMAGEGGRAESVQITPLEGPNLEGPQGGANITLNISAPLVDESVVDHIIPAINEAVRRGETLATS